MTRTADLSIIATGEGASDDLSSDLAAAFGGDVTREGMKSPLLDATRFVIEWGPHVLTGLGAIETATKIVDRVLGWLRTRPAVKLAIASPEGKIEIEAATREDAIALLSAALGQIAPKEL